MIKTLLDSSQDSNSNFESLVTAKTVPISNKCWQRIIEVEKSYLLRGLDIARGVGTPIAFSRWCMVGEGATPPSPRSRSGVWLRDPGISILEETSNSSQTKPQKQMKHLILE